MSTLTAEQIRRYDDEGFLVVPGVVSAAMGAALRQRAGEIVEAFDPSTTRTVFTTDEQTRHSDDWFLSSGDKIRCFFEAEALDADGELVVRKERAINKIGHALHDLDDVFTPFSHAPLHGEVLAELGLADARLLQSMYIFKQPSIGGEVGCHQDATFLYTEPVTVMGLWFALEDATLDNGCLWAAPGGHRTSLRKVFRRAGADNADGTVMDELDAAPLPVAPDELVPLPVEAGSMVVLHGLLPHWSGANRSPNSRHAYSVHCISAAAQYPAWNWLQRPPGLPLTSF